MKKEDVKIGMMVVPHSKHIGCELEDSNSWIISLELKQNYLFVIDWEEEEKCFVLSEIENDPDSGDFFNPEDFEPYEEISGSKTTLLDILEEKDLEKSLLTINKLIDSNFERNSTLEDIFKAIAEKWDSL